MFIVCYRDLQNSIRFAFKCNLVNGMKQGGVSPLSGSTWLTERNHASLFTCAENPIHNFTFDVINLHGPPDMVVADEWTVFSYLPGSGDYIPNILQFSFRKLKLRGFRVSEGCNVGIGV